MSDVKADLARTLDEAEWQWLEPHARRGALFLVASSLQLLDVALAVARDDAAAIQAWLEQGLLIRPARVQLEHWNATPRRRFMSVIVQPYVLCQELELELVN